LLTASAFEGVDRRSNLHVNETAILQHFLPGCARQTTGNSSGPEIDVPNRGFGHRLSVCDVGKLETATGAKDTIDFGEDGFLIGAKIYHTVTNNYIRPAIINR
jgi:hypothetical protein